MTCGIKEDNKVTVRIDDPDDHFGTEFKAHFEKGLSSLLADDSFLLLYVPENGGRMQVIRPASDSYHRKRMVKRINEERSFPSFYYALSHLWGLTESNRYLWHAIGDYVDDENGNPMKPVSMRSEKRDALLALLKAHPDSYWWIDVLCARNDTPLDIMGDIYSCCLECIAMIDCQPTLIPKIHVTTDAIVEVPEYNKTYVTLGHQLVKLLEPFFQSQWWQRVWTWQEMALPVGEVLFMAETDTQQLQTHKLTLSQVLEFINLGSDLLTRVGGVHENLYDIAQAKLNNKSRIFGEKFGKPRWIIDSLFRSKRRCYDPADYVYGVLGMLQIKIPRMEDPNEVWRHLLSELDDLCPPINGGRWIDRADEMDLRKVKAIGEVYRKLSHIDTGNK